MSAVTAPVGSAVLSTSRAAGATRMLGVSLQLAVAIYLIHLLRIEGHVFADRIAIVVAAGFLPHHLAPARHRLAIFVALSFAGIALIFGLDGIWLVGTVCLMIAACHLPIAYGWRVGLVLALGATLLLMRLRVIGGPLPPSIWPVLTSILMFRLIAYLYDVKHQRAAPGVSAALAYFFLLPNVAFPLFPVVDFATFKRTYYDSDPVAIYERGITWMLRGVFQLVLYRLIYQYAVISPAEVTSTASLVRYLLANFGLYLRVSGSFHLAVGILHLYGFHLPETHRLFYLASSFTDFWRRINIYWKEFMQKVVFAPVFYPLRRRIGDGHALTIATLAVFAATWFFHAYQWFWILGRWHWSTTDTLFWGILGAALVINSHREARRGRTRTLTPGASQATTTAAAWKLALGTAATFAVICTLWGLWTSPSLRDFFALFRGVHARPADLAILAAAPLSLGLIAVAVDRWLPALTRWMNARPVAHFVLAVIPVALVAVLSTPRLAGAFGGTAHRLAITVRSNRLNRQDAADLQRGYYEQLMEVSRFNGDLWRVYAERPVDWPELEAAGGRRSDRSFLMHELVPSHSMVFKRATLTTNQFGMRDRDRTIAKPAGTWRIALLGKSHVLGEGVPDDSTFAATLERRLNATRPPGAPAIEILNFAVSGYTPLQQAALMDGDRVRRFSPDVILYTGHATDADAINHLVATTRDSIAVPYDSMATIIRTAGMRRDFTYEQGRRALLPYRWDVVGWAYRHVADAARATGAVPAWIYLPLPLEHETARPTVTQLARDAGFTVLDVPEMYIDHDETDLVIAAWDNHPNTAAHQIIAARLFDLLLQHPELLGRGIPVTPRGAPILPLVTP